MVEEKPPQNIVSENSAMSLDDLIISTIAAGDRGEGVDYDAIIRECSVHGHSRQDAEDAIDSPGQSEVEYPSTSSDGSG